VLVRRPNLDPLVAVRADIQRYVRWLQEVRRYTYDGANRRSALSTRAELGAIQRRLHADAHLEAHHIQILESGPWRGTLHVLVVAAGPEQAELLRGRYGPHVAVASWLHRVPPDQPAAPTPALPVLALPDAHIWRGVR
jgi:hypothetical protein